MVNVQQGLSTYWMALSSNWICGALSGAGEAMAAVAGPCEGAGTEAGLTGTEAQAENQAGQ